MIGRNIGRERNPNAVIGTGKLWPRIWIAAQQAKRDEYAIVTFSLGSQIVIDALSKMAHRAVKLDYSKKPELRAFYGEMRNKSISVYMLANQLPVLHIGLQPKPERKLGARTEYCTRDNKGKWLDSLHIVAFSDPNDLLSYPIPEDFPDRQIDSRFCTKLTNVALNIASEVDLASFLAYPVNAHDRYM